MSFGILNTSFRIYMSTVHGAYTLHIIMYVCTDCEDETYVHSKLTKTENVQIFVSILFDAVSTHIEKINSYYAKYE